MTDYDIFLCYRGANLQACELAARIDTAINSDGLTGCFFAPTAIPHGHDFKKEIPTLMQNMRIVVLFLSPDFFRSRGEDDIVMFELDNALRNNRLRFLPIVFPGFNFDNEDMSHFSAEQVGRIKYSSAINYYGIYDDNLQTKILPNIYRLLESNMPLSEMRKRGGKSYQAYEGEIDYMHMQQLMLQAYDGEVRDPLLVGAKTILDVGCSDGCMAAEFANRQENPFVVGIDFQANIIEKAKYNHSNERTHFYVVDLDSPDLDEQLCAIKTELGIETFDFINITMVLLHIAKPYQVLKTLRKHLSRKGYMFIRDIDDDLNFFYPDDEGILRRLQNMVSYLDYWGYRKSGKEIYAQLKLAGFSQVQLAKHGLNTSQMSYDEREILFNVYFGYIPNDARDTIKTHPDNALLRGEARWAAEHIEEANELFHRSEFIFSLGYVIYIAQR